MTIVYEIVVGLFSILEPKAKGEYGRAKYINEQLVADSLIMGSSRAKYHYNPLYIGDYYNVGEDRMGIIFNYGRYLLICERGNPKVIIYDVEPDYDLLNERNNDLHTFLGLLRPYYHHQGIDSIFSDVDKTEKYKMLFPFYAYNSRLLKVLADVVHPRQTFHKGFCPLTHQDPLYPETEPQDKHLELKYQYLQKLVDDCKHNHTRLIFTASPQLSYGSDSVFHRFKHFCQYNKIPFINHFCDPKYTARKGLFANANHLNSKGANLYSKEIAREIKTYWHKQ